MIRSMKERKERSMYREGKFIALYEYIYRLVPEIKLYLKRIYYSGYKMYLEEEDVWKGTEIMDNVLFIETLKREIKKYYNKDDENEKEKEKEKEKESISSLRLLSDYRVVEHIIDIITLNNTNVKVYVDNYINGQVEYIYSVEELIENPYFIDGLCDVLWYQLMSEIQ